MIRIELNKKKNNRTNWNEKNNNHKVMTKRKRITQKEDVIHKSNKINELN